MRGRVAPKQVGPQRDDRRLVDVEPGDGLRRRQPLVAGVEPAPEVQHDRVGRPLEARAHAVVDHPRPQRDGGRGVVGDPELGLGELPRARVETRHDLHGDVVAEDPPVARIPSAPREGPEHGELLASQRGSALWVVHTEQR